MEPNIDTVIAKYAKRTPKKPSRGRTILLSLLIVCIAAAAVVGTLFLLDSSMTMTMKVTPQSTPKATDGPTAKEIVTTIASNDVISTAENYITFRTDALQSEATSDTVSVIYPQDGYSFITNVAAEDGLRFTLKSDKVASNKEALKTAIEVTLKNAGFSKVTQDTSKLSSYLTTTYLNGGTVCQIVDYNGGSKQLFLEQGVLCSSNAGLIEGYKKVTSLLATVDATLPQSAKVINQTTVLDTATPNKKLLSLSVKTGTNDASTVYYFASLDTSYEYIGKRPSPSVDDPSSYTLSAEVQKNISDPKWGTFLKDAIK